MIKTKGKMKRYFIVLAMFASTSSLFAHQPDLSATLLVQQEDSTWVVQVRAALTAIEYEVESAFGKDAYATPEEFNDLVLQYFRDHLQVHFNENHRVALKNGSVKLGHESNVSFDLSEAPEEITSITVLNRGFQDIGRSQSALSIYKKNYERAQFFLNDANEYSATIDVGKSTFSLAKTSNKNLSNFLSNLWPGLLFLSLGLVFIVGKRIKI